MTKPVIYQVVCQGQCLHSGSRLSCENYIAEHKLTVTLVREEIKTILVR